MRHLITSQQEPMTASNGFGFKYFDQSKRRNQNQKKKDSRDDETVKVSLLANEYYHDLAKKNLVKKAELPIEISKKQKQLNIESKLSQFNKSPLTIDTI